MTIKDVIGQLNEAITAAWTEYQAVGTLAVGVVGVLSLVAMAIVAKARKKPIKPLFVFIGTNLGLLLNAEGMWYVLTDPAKGGVPKGFAVVVFAVFELALLIAMDKAKASYQATAVRYLQDGLDQHGRAVKKGDIKRAGTAGSALGVVWFIALLSGTIVATNGGSTTTVLLRLGVPVVIVMLWWITVTAEAVSLARRSQFKYHPRRVLERRGILEAAEDDSDEALERQEAKHREDRMVTLGHRLESGSPGAWWWKRRLSSLARDADEATLERVARQVRLATSAVGRIAPSTVKPAKGALASAPSTAPVPALTSTPSTPEQHTASAPVPVLEASAPSTPAPALPPVPVPALPAALAPVLDPAPEDVLTERYPTTEEGLIEMLQRAARAGDGTLAVRAAQRLLTAPGSDKQCGPERARRLLRRAGLYTPPEPVVNGVELVPGA